MTIAVLYLYSLFSSFYTIEVTLRYSLGFVIVVINIVLHVASSLILLLLFIIIIMATKIAASTPKNFSLSQPQGASIVTLN